MKPIAADGRNKWNMRIEGSRLALAMFAAAAFVPGAAHADDAASDGSADTIVVTGSLPDDYSVEGQGASTRLDLSLRETPQSVSVVTRAQIEDFNLDTVDDLLLKSPGINVERSETDRTYYNARGFDIVNFQFDGIGQPLSYGLQNGAIDTALFERVEVVRGSTGLLSQTGNPSAAINFVRKRPQREIDGYASLSYGSYDRVRGDVDVNMPLTESGSVRARFVGAYEGGDSYIDFYKTSRLTLYGVAAADLGPDTVLTAGYSWQETDPQGVMWGAAPLFYADGTEAVYSRSVTTGQPWTRWRSLDRNFFTDLSHDFGGDWQGKISVLRRARNQNSKLFYVYGYQDPATGEGLFSWPSTFENILRETTIDAHINGAVDLGGQRHELVLGVNYGKSHMTETQALAPDATGISLSGDSAFDGSFPYPVFDDPELQADYKTEISSVYGLARISLADPFKIMLGGNVTRAKRWGTSYGIPYTFDRTKVLPFAGATFDISGNLTAYASYATIFNPQTETNAAGSILPPNTGETYEAGLKGAWSSGRLTAAVAVFRTTQKNVAQQLAFDEDLGRAPFVATDARSQGVEVDVAGEALPGLQLAGGYAYVHIEDNDGNKARTFIPRHTLRLSAVYSPPSFDALRFGVSARYQSRIYHYYESVDGEVDQDGYAVVDLMARYQVTPSISVAVNVDNVTDVKYWNSLQWEQGYYGAPRTARVTFGLGF